MNRLAQSTSPYLRQHAHNPVDWFEWTPEALALARREDKPILLSIGYAACHWCHVMAHESFEDENIAAAMNRLYVNIKLDREQRPDLDRVYQLSHQLLTQRGGGWPLTVFLDPQDLTAFFAGTYFPKEARYGLPGFGQVLEGVAQWYRSERDALRTQNARLREALGGIFGGGEGDGAAVSPRLRDVDTALRAWTQSADGEYGGLGLGQKFPHPVEWRLVAELATRAPSGVELPEGLIALLRTSLQAMARGGLNDHLGGGFYRYCVDRQWEIPHFEKMLYDNALLLPLFATAHQRWPDDGFGACAEGIVDFVDRELRAPGRGVQASLDADSEGHEGRFYVWTREQLAAAVPEPDLALAMTAYGLDRPPNFEEQAWHLTRRRPLAEAAAGLGLEPGQACTRLAQIRTRLFAVRATRVRPETNDQWLLGWNALLVDGLVRAGQALDRPAWITLAQTLYAEMRAGLRRADGNWVAFRGAAQAALPADAQPAFLDDLAWLLEAQLALLAAGVGGPALLADAIAVAERLAEQHAAPDGAFWFTSADDAAAPGAPPARPRSFSDEATPNGNGIALRALQRLGRLLGAPRWLDLAARGLGAAGAQLRRQPDALASVLAAVVDALAPPAELVWRGPSADLPAWQPALAAAAERGLLVWRLPDTVVDTPWPGALAAMPAIPGGRLYWCRDGACELPLDSVAALVARLQALAPAA